MKKEIFPALDWMLELQNEFEVQQKDKRKVEQWFFGQNTYHGSAIASSFAYGRISILENKTAKSISQSESFPRQSVARHLSSTIYVQSESNSNFYLASLLLLKSTALCSSFATGTETDVTKVQQLVGSSRSYSLSKCTSIYYVNFGSAFVSQSFFFESSKSKILNLQSKTLSNSRFFAAPSGPFAKLVLLTSVSISQSESLAKITRAFNIYSTIISQSISKVSDSISRRLSTSSNTQSLSGPGKNLKINLSSKATSLSKLNASKSIKQNLSSIFYSQTKIVGPEVLTRPLSARFVSQTYLKAIETRKINIRSQMVSQSLIKISGETVTRVLNGVAESISIAQRSFGSITRLFVSNSVSPSFNRATGGYITKRLHSSMYSQSYVHGSLTVSKHLAAKSTSQNPFHGNENVLLNKNSKAASATISSGQETITKPLASKSISQNPFHTNPNIFKELQAKSETQSFAKANGINKKINLNAESISQTDSNTQEHISRSLSSKTITQEYSDASISVKRNINSIAVTQTNSSAQEHITKPLFSKYLVQSVINKSNISIRRLISSTTQVSTDSVAQNLTKKINLTSKSIVQSDAAGNEIVARKLSAKGTTQSKSNAQGFNTLVNIYGSAISESFARSDLINKKINLHSEVIVQSYDSGTDTYLGNKQAEVTFAEPEVDQNVINLAPFNYEANNDL